MLMLSQILQQLICCILNRSGKRPALAVDHNINTGLSTGLIVNLTDFKACCYMHALAHGSACSPAICLCSDRDASVMDAGCRVRQNCSSTTVQSFPAAKESMNSRGQGLGSIPLLGRHD